MTDRAPPSPSDAIDRQRRHRTPWQLMLLGRVDLRGPSSSIQRWPTRAVAALLARLALAPKRDHPREELIELLWPGVALDPGRARLRQALSNLRSLLRPADPTMPQVLQADRQTVRLNPDTLDCDVLQFERHLAHGDDAAARACYVGDLMPGFYDDWIVAERHRLCALFERLPASTPTAPVQALARVRTTAAATAEVPAAPDTALPAYWSCAFGQDAAMARLAALVETRRLVTVLGPGGNGKTRLAVALARNFVHAHAVRFERIVFVPLVDDRTAREVLEALARALGAEGPGDARGRVVAALGTRCCLLILDNMEQTDVDVGAALEDLLGACPSLHLLLTSRRPLGLQGEQVFEMPGLQVPDAGENTPYRLDEVAASPAVALFVDRARESRPEFHLTAHNVGAVVDLVRLLGGMPLAIELAASRVRALQPREMLERLREDAGSPLLDLLARPSARTNARSRHASMRHVVAWSWAQQSATVQDLLRAMSVFAAPATVQAVAQALAGLHEGAAAAVAPGAGSGDGIATPELSAVHALLADALEASLVHTRPDGAAAPAGATKAKTSDPLPQGGRRPAAARTVYSLLPPVREYACEQCAQAERTGARQRLRRWLAGLADQGVPRHRAALHADLRHAWSLMLRAAEDDDPRGVLGLAVNLKGEWNWAPSMPEMLAVLEAALGRAGAVADAVVCQAHYVMAVQYQNRAQCAHATQHAERAVATAHDERTRAMALSIRCWLGLQQGADVATVQADLAASENHAKQCGDARVQALIDGLHAAVAIQYHEDHAAAEPLLQACIRRFDAQGDIGQAVFRRVELALCWASTGREAHAVEALETAVRTSRSNELPLILVSALTALGRVHMRLHDGARAQRVLHEAAQLAQRFEWSALWWPALAHLSSAWAVLGHARAAARLLGHAQARWLHGLGPINRPEARELERNRRFLRRSLGPARLGALMAAGEALGADDAVALLREVHTVMGDGTAHHPRGGVAAPTGSR